MKKKENLILANLIKNLAGSLTVSSSHNSHDAIVVDSTYLLWKLYDALLQNDSSLRAISIDNLVSLSKCLKLYNFDD